MHWIWISCQKCLKLQMGMAGPFFEPRPSNLVRIHFFLSCKSPKIFVALPQMVCKLAKSVWSAPSISWDVLGLAHRDSDKLHNWWFTKMQIDIIQCVVKIWTFTLIYTTISTITFVCPWVWDVSVTLQCTVTARISPWSMDFLV